jgi:hypothetical protein
MTLCYHNYQVPGLNNYTMKLYIDTGLMHTPSGLVKEDVLDKI